MFTKELHNLTCLIIANLAFADFISTNVSNLFSLIGKYIYIKNLKLNDYFIFYIIRYFIWKTFF